ncbi:MAG: acyl-CoA dehydrogenase family protein [Ilumatobacteraceae bacterium]
MTQFVVERTWSTFTTVGACDRALERTKEYCSQRHVFGKPLLANQYLGVHTCRAGRAGRHVARLQRGDGRTPRRRRRHPRQATIAKLTAGRLVREVADTCLQYHGGMGYVEENWPARFWRDNRLTAIGAGADEVMLQVLARLDGYM